MALSNFATNAIISKMPKVIQPKQHAILDYAVAGTFLALGAFFWGRSKRASIAAIACGAAVAANSLITDYPGGVTDAISFETHGEIDAALAGLTATLPNLLGFADEPEAKYFRGIAVAETAVTGLTDFTANTGGKLVEFKRRA